MKGVNEKDCVLPLIFVQPCGNFSSILLIDMLNFVGLFVAVLFLSRSLIEHILQSLVSFISGGRHLLELYVDFLYPLPSLIIISSTTIRKMCLTHSSLTPILQKEVLKYLIFWAEKCEEILL